MLLVLYQPLLHASYMYIPPPPTLLLHTPSHPFPSTMLYPSPSTMLNQPSHPPTLSPLLCYTHPPSSHSHPIYTHHTPSTQCSVGLYTVLYLYFHRWSSRSHGLSLSRELISTNRRDVSHNSHNRRRDCHHYQRHCDSYHSR